MGNEGGVMPLPSWAAASNEGAAYMIDGGGSPNGTDYSPPTQLIHISPLSSFSLSFPSLLFLLSPFSPLLPVVPTAAAGGGWAAIADRRV